jgi:hypothetical protein
VDAKILELIEAGKGKLLEAQAKEEEYQLRKREAWEKAWDEYDETMRQALPEFLRGYMTSCRPESEYNGEPPLGKKTWVRINIPGLAWISAEVVLTEKGWTMGKKFNVPVAYRDRNDYTGEHYVYFAGGSYATTILELDLALVEAERQFGLLTEKQKEIDWEKEAKLARYAEQASEREEAQSQEPVYVAEEGQLSIEAALCGSLREFVKGVVEEAG